MSFFNIDNTTKNETGNEMKNTKIENFDEIYKKDTFEQISENIKGENYQEYEELRDEIEEADISPDNETPILETLEKKNEFEEYDDELDEFDLILGDEENISSVEAHIYLEDRQKGCGSWDYTDDEIQQLMDGDTNEISFGITEAEKREGVSVQEDDTDIENLPKKTLSAEENGMRNSYWVDGDGIHHDDWKADAVEGTEKAVILETGTLLERHVFKGTEQDTGTYMAPYGTEFESKQLNYLEAAYDKNIYVANQPLPVVQSEVGDQSWQKADGALQYKLKSATIEDLLESKVLTKITPEKAEIIQKNKQKNI